MRASFYEHLLLYSQSAAKKTKRPAMRMIKVTGGLSPWKNTYSACPPNASRKKINAGTAALCAFACSLFVIFLKNIVTIPLYDAFFIVTRRSACERIYSIGPILQIFRQTADMAICRSEINSHDKTIRGALI